jgi:hypothetical protein
MASPSFGLTGGTIPGTSNNAPQPIPGNTNPTGTNNGVGFGATFPNYPAFGTASTGSPVSPSANAPLWSGTTGGLADLSSGFGSIPGGSQYSTQLYDMLGKAYGQGAGQLIGNMLMQGLFNPQDAAAILNAMGPSNAQGLASVQDSFGAEGARFGSSAALGVGNYESQVNLNEQSTLAQMYMQAQSEQLQLLQGVMPTIHQEQSDKGGFMHDLSDVFQIAYGIGELVTGPIPGQVPTGLISGANNTSAPISSPSSSAPANTAPISAPDTTTGSDFGTMSSGAIDDFVGSSSAGADLGGASASAGGLSGLTDLAALFA